MSDSSLTRARVVSDTVGAVDGRTGLDQAILPLEPTRSITSSRPSLPDEPPVTSAEALRFDYFRYVKGVVARMANRGANSRLLLSPECNGGSPAAVASSGRILQA